jgi:hypothetical protein
MSEKRDHAAPRPTAPFSGAAGPGKRPPTPQRAAGDPVSDRLNALSERLNAPPGAFTPPKAILLCPLTKGLAFAVRFDKVRLFLIHADDPAKRDS